MLGFFICKKHRLIWNDFSPFLPGFLVYGCAWWDDIIYCYNKIMYIQFLSVQLETQMITHHLGQHLLNFEFIFWVLSMSYLFNLHSETIDQEMKWWFYFYRFTWHLQAAAFVLYDFFTKFHDLHVLWFCCHMNRSLIWEVSNWGL